MPLQRRAAEALRAMTKNKKIGISAAAGIAVAAGLAFWPSYESIVLPFLPAREEVTVFFAGDVMLDRNVAKRSEEFGKEQLFSSTTRFFLDADLAVLNLEGTITPNQSIARRNSSILRFTFDPEFARAVLAPLQLDAVSLANNHAIDFYERGFSQTKNYLSEWGIQSFGHPNNEGKLSVRLEVRGKTICVVGYHGLYEAATESVVAEIQNIRKHCWRIVVMSHWGLEYEPTPESATVHIAHEFIDAGADVIIGAHPHVVQTLEIYQGKPIFYSLGNFMFDQDFSWETMHGLGVKVSFSEEETHFTLIPTSVVYSRSGIAAGSDKAAILEALTGEGLSLEIASGVRAGAFSLPVERTVAP